MCNRLDTTPACDRQTDRQTALLNSISVTTCHLVEYELPFLCQLFNCSLEHGSVPSSFKCAYITPLLKKADLDPADVEYYQPISNLSVISKLLE